MKKIIYLIITLNISISSYCQTADNYTKSGLAKYELNDYIGAISDYTKAIGIDSNYSKAYYNRVLDTHKYA